MPSDSSPNATRAKHTLRSRVGTATVVFCLAVGILSFATLGSIKCLLSSTQQALRQDADQCRVAQEIVLEALQCRRLEQSLFVLLNDLPERAKCYEEWQQASNSLDRAIQTLGQSAMSDDERRLVAQCASAHHTYREAFQTVVAQIERGEITSATEANAAMLPAKKSIQALTVNARHLATRNIVDVTDRMDNTAAQLSMSAVALCIVLASIVGAVVGWKWWFQRAILDRIQQLQDAVARFAEGDLEARAEVCGADELDLIAGQFNRMARNLSLQHMELSAAKEAADASNQAKGEFLANISHELRTPLHGILSYARFGIDEASTAEREELSGYFQTISQCSQTLLSLVNDLLDLAKLEAGRMRMQFEQQTILPVVACVVDEFDSLCSERDIHIRCEASEDVELTFDSERIKQVIRNLLSNAVKFSPPGGCVTVGFRTHGDVLSVSVADEGHGIPPEELEAVFDKFVQSSKTKSGSGGTGLGLAICRQIIAAHRGRIWAENNPQGGARLSFELPLHLEASPLDESPIMECI